jgi:nucleotide-binding universal stress UspA family protein
LNSDSEQRLGYVGINCYKTRIPMPRFTKILCPVDFDQNSLLALGLACELAQEARKATLDVLHVVPIPPGPEVTIPFDKLERAARLRLERLARNRIDPKLRHRVHVTTGDPGGEVVRMAEQIGADLIVMATHGRRGLRRFILGSVAERVVREAPCAVLTVKQKARGGRTVTSRSARA